MPPSYDYVIVGSGIAGLYAALLAREHGTVLVITKSSIDECNTRYAQGGIAAALGKDDSAALHAQDTVAAGAGLVDEAAATILANDAAERIDDLVRIGVPFDTIEGEVSLGREGAHNAARVLHAGGDFTGAHIELTLSEAVRRAGVEVREYCLATHIRVEDGEVMSVLASDGAPGSENAISCRNLIFASGGAGQMYQFTTNPAVATGDGIALAYRAGAEIADMEFFQFHPTALRLPGVRAFLISEAVRGEGGVLLNAAGERFMPDYHPTAELAPRDIVARAIHSEMMASGTDHVYLDVTHLPTQWLTARFPQIYQFCREHGLDIGAEPIPVSPAAHYTTGGIRTNTWGETTLAGLYACGECASTGVHGANRLASNSLLETVVFAKRVIERSLRVNRAGTDPTAGALPLTAAEGGEAPVATREGLQELMWREVGIVRTAASLSRAKALLAAWDATRGPPHDMASHELANLVTCSRLTAEAALLREESRGAHYRSDFPEPQDSWRRHIVFRRP